jgi:hypothetical protein
MSTETDTRGRDWHPIAWVALVGLTVAEIITVVAADFLIVFGQSSTCGKAPDPSEVRDGRLALLGVLLVAVMPWLIALSRTRHRLRIGVAAMLVGLPAAGWALAGLADSTWVGSFCF